MSINATLLGQMIVFGVFVWVVMKFIWPPIVGAMAERQKRIADGLAAADRGARELNQATDKAENLLKESREQAQEILNNAQKQANDNVERSREEARAEGERLVEAAQDDIRQSIAQAKEELRREVGQLAVAGAEQILKREVDAKAHNDIIDNLIADIR